VELAPEQLEAVRQASTDAFHLAMLIAALLCAAGAAVNWVGISDLSPEARRRAADEPAAAA
jgi:hypothetical protein